MLARRSSPVWIALLCVSTAFLMARDSGLAAAGPVPDLTSSTVNREGNPAARILPVLNLLLLEEDAPPPPPCLTHADCDDGNPCTDDACDPALGCVHTSNAAPCEDGNACTTNDTCSEGACVGGPPLDCDDKNPCTDDACDPAAGCLHTNNSAPCDDGSVCTTVDVCSGGVCVGGPPWLQCDNGNPCTLDYCDAITGCNHLCQATGRDDPCCQEEHCSWSPICRYPGGLYVTKVTALTQTPWACFLNFIEHGILMGLITGIEVPVYLPWEGAYPTELTLGIPFLGNLNVYARFENNEVSFDEVVIDSIHLADYAAFLPPEFAGAAQCVLDAKAVGWTQGLSADGFTMTVQVYDLVVTREYPGAECFLYGRPLNPSCRLNFTITGTRAPQ